MPALLIPILIVGAVKLAVDLTNTITTKYAEYEMDKYIDELKKKDELKKLQEDVEQLKDEVEQLQDEEENNNP
jgi:uncharacterized protein YlxW (UPF0749 family)